MFIVDISPEHDSYSVPVYVRRMYRKCVFCVFLSGVKK